MFPTDTLQQKIEINDLKPFFLAAKNTSVLTIIYYFYACSNLKYLK